MNVYEYCNSLERELSLWKEKLADVTNRIDELPSIDKYKLTPHIEGLHILLTEMNDRLEKIRVACPVDWPPDETEYTKVGDLADNFKESEGVEHDYDFGG
jgi:hypothetical protein